MSRRSSRHAVQTQSIFQDYIGAVITIDVFVFAAVAFAFVFCTSRWMHVMHFLRPVMLRERFLERHSPSLRRENQRVDEEDEFNVCMYC